MAGPGRLVVAISPRKSAGYVALLVCAWGLTLAPLLHSFHHRDDHRHGPTGGVEQSGWHVHADGTAHDGPLADAPAAPLDPVDPVEPLPRRPAHPAPGGHGDGSLAHFGAALISVPPILLALRPASVIAEIASRPVTVVLPGAAPSPGNPRAPPVPPRSPGA